MKLSEMIDYMETYGFDVCWDSYGECEVSESTSGVSAQGFAFRSVLRAAIKKHKDWVALGEREQREQELKEYERLKAKYG
jgi:hypothetical protein